MEADIRVEEGEVGEEEEEMLLIHLGMEVTGTGVMVVDTLDMAKITAGTIMEVVQ